MTHHLVLTLFGAFFSCYSLRVPSKGYSVGFVIKDGEFSFLSLRRRLLLMKVDMRLCVKAAM